ncbi:trypsin-like peptidase domain-containing protein [Phenylobacterium sp.]|uniref:S1C family serine protease n=1 Tax=Phenylobacterium sp. TaxID=1871053 RepID=UPI0035B2EECC
MPSFASSSAPTALPPGLPSGAGAARTARFGKVVAQLQSGAGATRGAKEAEVYKDASPAVVLVMTDTALGSGALIDAEGHILTNLHVVGDSDTVGVVFKPKAEGAEIGKADVRLAEVVRRDEVADLALLRVAEPPERITPLKLGDMADVQVGADVHAIGHPTGEAWTYTRGIVSQVRKDYEWAAEDRLPHKATVIQTQTPINPGNSGGPLLDDKTELVGVNSFKGDGEGLNFAVSIDDVKAFLTRTGDRMIDPEVKAKATCEEKVVGQRRSRKPRGVEYDIDSDCDGQGDYVTVVPDDKKLGIMSVFDTNSDGLIDMMLFDDDRDGQTDAAYLDTDGDGKPDLRGDFRPGESEPYRYEKISQ